MGTVASAGRLVAIEGGEGAGKSRLQTALGERLIATGRDIVLTREPGGTALGEQIRALLLARRSPGSADATLDDDGADPLAELLLFEAARAHLIATIIRPALARGAIVLCDRFAASSVAYQGGGRGLGREIVEHANAIATGRLAAHLTLLLDLPVEAGLARRAGDGGQNHFDAESLEFHQRVRDTFLALAAEAPDTWRVIDAAPPFHDVVEAAHRAITAML